MDKQLQDLMIRCDAIKDSDRYDEKIELLTQIIARVEDDNVKAMIFNNRGVAYADKGEHGQAISNYNQAIKLNPECAYAFNNRGIAYADKGKYNQAISDYNQAIKLKPEYVDAFNGRGVAYAGKDEHDQAIRDYNQAIELNPKHAEAFNNRGVVHKSKGEYDQAISDYNQAIELNPKYADAFNNRGNAYRDRGEYDQAISDYNQTIKLNPKHAEAFNNRGIAYAGEGEYDQAISDYNQTIKLNPKHVKAFSNRGNAYADKGEYDQAISDYNQAIKLKPEYADAFNNRGNAYANKGEHDQAISNYNHAIKIKPQNANIFYNRGLTYLAKDNEEKALEDFQEANKLDPATVIPKKIIRNKPTILPLKSAEKQAMPSSMVSTLLPEVLSVAFIQKSAGTLKASFKNLGPLKNAEIELNDLTIIAGKNNSGKTYISYAIYGFLNNLHDHLQGIEIKAIDIQDIAKQLSTKGVATRVIDDAELNKLSKDFVEAASENYSKSLHKYFSSPKSHFENTVVNFDVGNSDKIGVELKFKTGASKNTAAITVARHDNELIFTLKIAEIIPDFIVKDMVNSALIGFLINRNPPFVITAERFGVSLFYKDLDTAKNRIVEMLQKMENKTQSRQLTHLDILDKFSSYYATAIQENIDYVRDLDTNAKATSDINTAKLFDYIKDMMDAYYRVNENEIRLISKKHQSNKFDIPLHLASSSTRGLMNLYFFLKSTAKKGQLLIIDEPESHLNPENQIRMARLLAMCVSAGLKVLITTHSDYFIKEINNLIMLSGIDSKKEFLAHHKGYKKEMFLSENKVSGYICENGKIKKCESNKFGLEMYSFDNTITEINKISRHLTATLSNDSDE